ncbi:DEAD/DEAH box helicase [Caldicellulosiruptor acetigenus]|uniref:DNA 3'-5' helicase n=1 Tax=Caldicellulosiruptor acetigenus 6A TaxID=632516 RepID=G2PVE0_9FIRM|nr:DEAD/DEAH box helicase [Caldicellulosiruptor acetigenus]AEM73652.1 DEAD/DEAH box helicase domain protein [Caldicellulosiruptor acetigenus 6A]
MYPTLLDEFLQKNSQKFKDSIIFFKGFPAWIYRYLFQKNFTNLSGEYFLNSKGYIDVKKFFDYDKRKYTKEILDKSENIQILWGFYEELVYISTFLSLSLFGRKPLIVNNNLFNIYYPVDIELSDEEYSYLKQIQEKEESQPILNQSPLDIYYQFYADIKKNKDVTFVSYINKHTDEGFEEINFFDEIDFDYSIGIADKNTISVNDIQYPLVVNKIQNGEIFDEIKIQLEEEHNKKQISPFVNLCRKINQPVTIIKGNKFYNKEETANKYLYILKKYWGEENEFRELKFYKDPDKSLELETISQGHIISEIISQCEKAYNNDDSYNDIFITAPTGSGKSLLFQIPAIYLAEEKNAVTIIVSPLISLMRDQVESLKDNGVNFAETINSQVTYSEKEIIIQKLKDGEISIIYLSPEFLLSSPIETLIGNRKLGLFVIDEAHLVTTWGRDFRVDYWYLGDYIKKLRELLNMKFPVVCLTATAVYQGPDDMVLETVENLNLRKCKYYLGPAKRENIEFEIKYHKDLVGSHDRFKIERAKERIEEFLERKEKSVIYCPYTTHVESIYNELDAKYKHFVGKYYGDLDKLTKNDNQVEFKEGLKKIMICTKAFGMGVDVKDIVNIYHYAPTGNLADYVQEIGRAARNPKLVKGKAIIDFTPKDLRYIRTLYGLSAIRQYQLKEMMRKLCEIYDEKKVRNILVSPEAFSYIFSNESDLENKVKSGLMLISKDLYQKYQYPVLFVRPRGLFSHNYIHVPYSIVGDFEEMFGEYLTEITIDNTRVIPSIDKLNGDTKIIDSGKVFEINLAKLWEEKYSNKTFAEFKREFFEGSLFEFSDKIAPRVRFRVVYKYDFDDVIKQMENVMEKLVYIFDELKTGRGNKLFTSNDFLELFKKYLSDFNVNTYIANLILQLFLVDEEDKLDAFTYNATDFKFIQHEVDAKSGEKRYRVCSYKYRNIKSHCIRLLFGMKPDRSISSKIYEKYLPVSKGEWSKDNKDVSEFIKIASLLEIFKLASYEVFGGRNIELFIRINDPQKLRYLANNPRYTNSILSDIERRRKKSEQILTEFFSKQIDNKTRWDIIELYFLGKMDEVENLLSQYKSEI